MLYPKKLDLGLGMALGLFAVFAIVRFRTNAIQVKEMTYLFLVIGLAVINSLSNKKTSYIELLFTNTVILFLALYLEQLCQSPQFKKSTKREDKLPTQEFVIDNLDLLQPGRREELVSDLAERSGLNVQEVAVKKIEMSKELALVVVKYLASEPLKPLQPLV